MLSSGCIKLNGAWDQTIQVCSLINVGANSTNTTAYGMNTNISIHGNLTLSVVQNGNNVDIKLATTFTSITVTATLLKLSEPTS